ncbi:hypothetical protein ABID39_001289 [Bartonella japonica]|uniref:Uncharacterized protein n=1 Tax=Bartonella japonica TaxID=357761 RepID=A0ABV2FQ19_9HYPH
MLKISNGSFGILFKNAMIKLRYPPSSVAKKVFYRLGSFWSGADGWRWSLVWLVACVVGRLCGWSLVWLVACVLAGWYKRVKSFYLSHFFLKAKTWKYISFLVSVL